MANFFNSVRITNFKSLKDVTLSDCKRINLLIGKPNVGKSNILEAIGLLGLPYYKQYNATKKITQFVRMENLRELFFDGNVNEEINIITDNGSICKIDYEPDVGKAKFTIILPEEVDLEFLEKYPKKEKHVIVVDQKFNLSPTKKIEFEITKDTEGKITSLNSNLSDSVTKIKGFNKSRVKFFKFPQVFVSKIQPNSSFSRDLRPPNGFNLLEVIEYNKSLENELTSILSGYGLQFLFDKTNNSLRIMKALKADSTMVSFPYSSIADTLQRIIFFKTAIVSSHDSILLFEEPEAHCFPPYIRQITQDIIDSDTNQFFIATHSPYVLNDFLEYERNDVAIFIANFKNGETVIRRLTDEEVNDVYQYGIDLFFNHELFTDDQEH
ncbi:MAG: AAA family ATPase [Methylovulum sp.]|nr:AAA family ATPase [Methylovulum sp.]